MQINRIRYSNSPIHPNPNLIKRHSRKSKTENNIDIYIHMWSCLERKRSSKSCHAKSCVAPVILDSSV
ncbi:hypothetical protein HBI26_061300 [Parastagonospora nodorum]|nr:hypothetical protein HBH42_088760 [Parastagonospora nodorum]KAH4212298.1 hypothetical protein HBI95_035530 [Parastagonospora nodorum]KAH4610458.1 hypothetical protein HBH82_051840 [Parastagonospora nodorum]KAH4680272.1 hypothetical protein HBH78_134910 [Parastagonospora nodorum]KAH4711916.1 hypothetical protein HBH67_012760 [Parastagonospora nodorum]